MAVPVSSVVALSPGADAVPAAVMEAAVTLGKKQRSPLASRENVCFMDVYCVEL